MFSFLLVGLMLVRFLGADPQLLAKFFLGSSTPLESCSPIWTFDLVWIGHSPVTNEIQCKKVNFDEMVFT